MLQAGACIAEQYIRLTSQNQGIETKALMLSSSSNNQDEGIKSLKCSCILDDLLIEHAEHAVRS